MSYSVPDLLAHPLAVIVNVRVNQATSDALTARSRETGQSESLIVRQAVAAWLAQCEWDPAIQFQRRLRLWEEPRGQAG